MIPNREVATNNGQTYFVTSNSAERKPFFDMSDGPRCSLKRFMDTAPSDICYTDLF